MDLSINTSHVAHANHLQWATGEDNQTHKITAKFEYSASKFKDGKRTNQMAIGVCAIILDVDDGLSLKQGIELFSSYKSLIVTTKSHQVAKKGLVADRYRVILFLNICIIDMIYYSNLMKVIIRHFGADIACSDPARYYSPNPKQLVYYSDSKEYFDIRNFDEQINSYEDVVQTHITRPIQKEQLNHNSTLPNRIDLSKYLENEVTYYRLGVKTVDTLKNLVVNTEVSNTAIQCHCFLNSKHEDKNPSCFIYRNKNNIFAKCVVCNIDGLLYIKEHKNGVK